MQCLNVRWVAAVAALLPHWWADAPSFMEQLSVQHVSCEMIYDRNSSVHLLELPSFWFGVN